jgi:hypothetical protein
MMLAPSCDQRQWLGQKIWAATFYAASKGIISYRLVVSGASNQDEVSPQSPRWFSTRKWVCHLISKRHLSWRPYHINLCLGLATGGIIELGEGHLLKTGADDGVSRLAYKQRMATADPRR